MVTLTIPVSTLEAVSTAWGVARERGGSLDLRIDIDDTLHILVAIPGPVRVEMPPRQPLVISTGAIVTIDFRFTYHYTDVASLPAPKVTHREFVDANARRISL